ncbi:MAG: YgjV family protein [Patescibacteria group bacterium]
MTSLKEVIGNFWPTQILGVIALLFVGFALQSKERKQILRRQSLGSFIFAVHYWLLSAYTGAIMSLVVAFRNLVFDKKSEKQWARNRFWLYSFMAFSVMTLLFSWRGPESVFPVLGVIIGTSAVWQTKPVNIRFYMLLAALAWIPYTLIVHSYSGFFAQILGIGFIVFGVWRFDTRKEAKTKEPLSFL